MKKIKLVVLILILLSLKTVGQNIDNGNFAINNGNDGASCGSYGTFDPNSVNNWKQSHGTPHFYVGSGGTTNLMSLWNSRYNNEGILGGYEFKRTKQYCIRIKLKSWDFNGNFYVYATSNVPTNTTLATDCGGTEPILPAKSELITYETTMKNDYYFTFQPLYDNNQIFITSYGEDQHTIRIELIDIYSGCKDNLTFSNGLIPPSTHFANTIFAGTSVGIGGSIVTNDPINTTVLEAYESVTLLPDFVATASPEGLFQASIELSECVFVCHKWFTDGPDKSLREELNQAAIDGNSIKFKNTVNKLNQRSHGNPLSSSQILKEYSDINIYPNPSTGYFTVDITYEGEYDLKIVNAIGSVVYNTKVKGGSNIIQPTKNLPNGNYSVHISGKDIRHVEKLTIVK